MSTERGTGLLPGAFRKKRNLMLGVLSEISAPLLRPIASLVTRGGRTGPAEWRRGLIVGHNHIGDVLYRTPSLPALRKALPDCRWSYLTSPSSAPILAGNPNLEEVLPWCIGDDSWNLDSSHLHALREKKFDVVLCTNTLHHYPDFFLATRLGIPNRAGFVHKGLSGLINHPVPIEFPSPYAGYFRSMVAALTNTSADWPLTPQIFLSPQDRSEADDALRSAGVTGDKPMLACTLTSRQRRGNWPLDSMVSVLREASRLADFDLVLCGAADDEAQLHATNAMLGGSAKILAGRVSIRGFAAVLERSDALFCIDSGPRHVGNAVGTNVVFARNLSHSRVEAGRYCDTETDIAPADEYLSDDEIGAVSRSLDVHETAKILTAKILSGAPRA